MTGLRFNTTGGLEIGHVPALTALDGVGHFITTRRGGASLPPYDELNLGAAVGDDPEAVAANREQLARALELPAAGLVTSRQVHGAAVRVVKGLDLSTHAEADAMICREPGIALTVLVADCAPILAADPVARAVGIAHAGWRGTVAGVTAAMIAALVSEFGCDPANVHLAIGPSIGPEDYEVGPEVVEAARGAQGAGADEFLAPVPGSDRHMFDLWAANRLAATNAGVPPGNIAVTGVSTAGDTTRFYSHRASGGRTGRFAAGVYLITDMADR